MRPQIPIHWNPQHHHPPRSQIPRQCHKRQRTRRINLIRIDDIHVSAHKHGDDAEANDARRDDGRPDGDGGVVGPGHPEEADGDEGRAVHGKEEAGFAVEVGAVAGVVGAGELARGLGVDDGDEDDGGEDAEDHGDEYGEG